MPKLTPNSALRPLKVISLAVIFLFTTQLWLPSALALTADMHDLGSKDGVYHGTLESDEYAGYVIDGLGSRDSISVKVVVSGFPVDVYLFTSLDFQRYINPKDKIVPPLWGEEVIYQASGKYAKSIEEMVVVIDNTDISRYGAKPEGPITYTLTLERIEHVSILPILLLLLSAVAFLIGMVAYRIRRRNRHRTVLYAPEEFDEEGQERRIRRSITRTPAANKLRSRTRQRSSITLYEEDQ